MVRDRQKCEVCKIHDGNTKQSVGWMTLLANKGQIEDPKGGTTQKKEAEAECVGGVREGLFFVPLSWLT